MSSALATRSLDSFAIFDSDEFVSGYQGLVTIQPLNKTKRRGWFLRKSNLETCKWTAKESDFDKGSVIWDYEHTFVGGSAPDVGLNFIAPRLQVLLRSPLLIEETGNNPAGSRLIIGTFNDDECKELWDADKAAADTSKPGTYSRKYGVRTKMLVYLLTKDNQRAHDIPIVLTLKGLNSTDFSDKIKMFEREMSNSLNKALGKEVPLQHNEKFYGTTVFCPKLVSDMRGSNGTEICAIEEFDIPDYSSKETAIESLHKFSIPNEDRETSWKFQKSYENYIMIHSKQTSIDTNGMYALKGGVEILPENRTQSKVEVLPPVRDQKTGEDSSF
jgi:hypothetical protein